MGQRREWMRNRIAAYGWGPVRRWTASLAGIGLWCGAVAGVSWAARAWWSDQREAGWVDWAAAWESFSAGESGRDLWLVGSGTALVLAACVATASVPYVWAALRRSVRLRPWRPFVVAPRTSGWEARVLPVPDVHLRAPRVERIISPADPEPVPAPASDSAFTAAPAPAVEPEPAEACAPVVPDVGEPSVDSDAVVPPAVRSDGGDGLRVPPTSQPVLPLEPEMVVSADESRVLYVTRGIEDLSSEAIETLAWAFLQNRMVSPSEMARLLGLKKPTVRRRCTRLAERGWLKVLGDNSYELSAAVRADVDLLAEACRAGDESGAVALAESVTGRPFAQVNAEWLDAQHGGPSYREELTERAADALAAGIEAFPEQSAVFESAANRLYGD